MQNVVKLNLRLTSVNGTGVSDTKMKLPKTQQRMTCIHE